MQRLRKTALALALGESVALGSGSPASAQTAAQPVAAEATSNSADSTREGRAERGAAAASSTTGTSTSAPSNVSGGYTWRNKAPLRKSGHRHTQKVDPTRAQAKGPEFVISPDGTSHISVQLSQRVGVSLTTHPGQLIFELPTTQVAVPNDSNPLVTTHFATPVNTVRLTAHGKNARLIIELRESTSPAYQVRQLPAGATALEISLPKPSHGARPVGVESRPKTHSKAAKPRK